MGCSETEIPTTAEQLALDRELIRAYIKAEGLEMDSLTNGVYYKVLSPEPAPGTRPAGPPNAAHWVLLDYEAFTLNGTLVDAAQQPRDTFLVRKLLPGLQSALGQLKTGQSGIAIIPSTLAYKTASFPNIPANSVLRFNLTVEKLGLEDDD